MKKWMILTSLLVCCLLSEAQFSRYIIRFRDKATTPFAFNNPSQYLSQRAIDRRTRYSIAVDSTDFPITPRYLDSLRAAGAVTVLNPSRWLNQVSIQTTDAAALTKIRSFPFVISADAIAARTTGRSNVQSFIPFPYLTPSLLPRRQRASRPPASNLRRPTSDDVGSLPSPFRTAADYFNYGSSYNQVHIHNGEFLHNIGLRGQGLVIGMFDGGFRNYTTLRAFDSVRLNGQILSTWDFVAREASVVEDDAHGMMCFSVIAADLPNQFVGTAPKASFHLFRSEDAATEFQIEEHNWVCAAERLDSAGGDLISSSVGYSDGMSNPAFNHTYAEMNGNTTIAARGADMAARKGILVGQSAGNDGNGGFRFISTPADGDSVMAVGATNAAGVVAGFSSYGPSSDGQVKPDVASVGVNTVVYSTANTVGVSNGTSFSNPNMVGLATCLWQGFPEANNMRILNALRQAGNKFTTPDDRVGYGIPDVKKALVQLTKDFFTATITAGTCRTTINFTGKDMSAMKYEIERRLATETSFTRIGDVVGTGDVFATRSRSFVDSQLVLQSGTVSYRIRQIFDTAAGSFTADYVDTISVNLTQPCFPTSVNPVASADNAVVVQPNPTPGDFAVKVSTSYAVPKLFIRISNVKGQIISTLQRSKSIGTTTFTIPAHALPRGEYYISVYNDQKLIATKELLKL